jgi:hypothetical protein
MFRLDDYPVVSSLLLELVVVRIIVMILQLIAHKNQQMREKGHVPVFKGQVCRLSSRTASEKQYNR